MACWCVTAAAVRALPGVGFSLEERVAAALGSLAVLGRVPALPEPPAALAPLPEGSDTHCAGTAQKPLCFGFRRVWLKH